MRLKSHIRKLHHLIYVYNPENRKNQSFLLPSSLKFDEISSSAVAVLESSPRKIASIEKMCKASGTRCKGLGIFDGSRCVGYGWAILKGGENCHYRVIETDCYICRCIIDPDYRGQGLFKCLIEEMVNRYCPRGRCSAAVSPSNVASRKSFEALGFSVYDERKFWMVYIKNISKALRRPVI